MRTRQRESQKKWKDESAKKINKTQFAKKDETLLGWKQLEQCRVCSTKKTKLNIKKFEKVKVRKLSISVNYNRWYWKQTTKNQHHLISFERERSTNRNKEPWSSESPWEKVRLRQIIVNNNWPQQFWQWPFPLALASSLPVNEKVKVKWSFGVGVDVWSVESVWCLCDVYHANAPSSFCCLLYFAGITWTNHKYKAFTPKRQHLLLPFAFYFFPYGLKQPLLWEWKHSRKSKFKKTQLNTSEIRRTFISPPSVLKFCECSENSVYF